MTPELDHLPRHKQRELAHVVRVLLEEFGEQTARAAHGWAKRGRILKVILNGDQARGDQGEGGEGTNVPYAVVAVVNDARFADRAKFWAAAEERLLRDATANNALSARVHLVVRGLRELNDKPGPAHPVFDIVGRGIVLYEVEGFALPNPRELRRRGTG